MKMNSWILGALAACTLVFGSQARAQSFDYQTAWDLFNKGEHPSTISLEGLWAHTGYVLVPEMCTQEMLEQQPEMVDTCKNQGLYADGVVRKGEESDPLKEFIIAVQVGSNATEYKLAYLPVDFATTREFMVEEKGTPLSFDQDGKVMMDQSCDPTASDCDVPKLALACKVLPQNTFWAEDTVICSFGIENEAVPFAWRISFQVFRRVP